MDSNCNFLEVYDDVLSKEECDKVIETFESISPLSGRKVYGSGNASAKQATTLFCDVTSDLFDTFNQPVRSVLVKGLTSYKSKYSFLHMIRAWALHPYYNIQKYEEGQGYFTLHNEQDNENPSRMLVWMLYLNDAECGTEFPYQDKVTDAKRGRLVLWPAAWTHPHKGVTPNKGLKYIATGWYCYEK